MAVDFLKRLALFFGLCLAQVFVLNHVYLFDVATPLLYVYFAITFRRNYPKWQVLVWSFALGLVMDMFTNTPGLAAGSMTLIALLQTYLIEMLAPRDSAEDLNASIAAMGISKFATLSAILTSLYCLVFFALEAFTFFDWLLWLERVIGSTVLTVVLILAIDTVRTE
jgi:rod shape-determining protein MreD